MKKICGEVNGFSLSWETLPTDLNLQQLVAGRHHANGGRCCCWNMVFASCVHVLVYTVPPSLPFQINISYFGGERREGGIKKKSCSFRGQGQEEIGLRLACLCGRADLLDVNGADSTCVYRERASAVTSYFIYSPVPS